MVRLLSIMSFAAILLVAFTATAQEKKDGDKKDRAGPKSGKVIGTLVGIGKEKKAIEVKADGEEKARMYVPHWVGGAPAQGGGPDKKMVAIISKLKVGSRVEVDWEYEERLRVIAVKVLKEPAPKEKD